MPNVPGGSPLPTPRDRSLDREALPAPPRPILGVDGLSKSFEGETAVVDLSFEVRGGEILGMVGPNGAGKTTSLRSIVGVLPIQSGRVTVCGYDVSLREREAKSQLAWVPENPQPFDSLTVFEHLEFTAELYGVDGWCERAEHLLDYFDLREKREALGGELSRGMRQKLAFCCAWLPRPRLVLLDEPLSGLDPRGIRSAKQAIRDVAAEGTAVILSSHLLELIEALASRILILDRGRVVFDGTLLEARATLAPAEGSSLEEIFLAATERGAVAPSARPADWSSAAEDAP